jgi:hypothetical protein
MPEKTANEIQQALFIGLSLVVIFFTILPPQPVNPDWQLKLISAIVSNSIMLLLGSVLVCYASRREELDQKSLRQVKLLRTILAWASLGVLLMVLVQFSATTGIIRSNYSNGMATMRRLQKMTENLDNTRNEQEFRVQLSRFSEMPNLPEKFDEPYRQVRKSIVESLTSRRLATINELAKVRDQSLQASIKDNFRNSATMVLISHGFMAIALSDPSKRNVITSLAMFLGKMRANNLWFATPKRRKTIPINPAWTQEDKNQP